MTSVNDGKMPILDHLIELRRRLLWSLCAFLVAFAICYWRSRDIYGFLVYPLAKVMESHGDTDRRMIFTSLTEAFWTYVRVSCFAAAFLSFPVWLVQIWAFVAPGLYNVEKKVHETPARAASSPQHTKSQS